MSVSVSDLLEAEPWSECGSSKSKLSNSGTGCVFMASAISPMRNSAIALSLSGCVVVGIRNETKPVGGPGGPASSAGLL